MDLILGKIDSDCRLKDSSYLAGNTLRRQMFNQIFQDRGLITDTLEQEDGRDARDRDREIE